MARPAAAPAAAPASAPASALASALASPPAAGSAPGSAACRLCVRKVQQRKRCHIRRNHHGSRPRPIAASPAAAGTAVRV